MAGLMGAVPPIFKQRERPSSRNELGKTGDQERFRTLRIGAKPTQIGAENGTQRKRR